MNNINSITRWLSHLVVALFFQHNPPIAMFRALRDPNSQFHPFQRFNALIERSQQIGHHKNVRLVFLFKLNIFLFLYQSVFQVYLCVTDLSYFEHVVHFNIPYLLTASSTLNKLWASLSILAAINCYFIFAKMDNRLLLLMRELLFAKNVNLFSQERYKGKPVLVYIRKMFYRTSVLLELNIYCVCFSCVIFTLYTVILFHLLIDLRQPIHRLYYFFFWINLVQGNHLMYSLIYLFNNCINACMLMLLFFTVAFKQCHQILIVTARKSYQWDSARFYLFYRNFIHTMHYFFTTNTCQGAIFTRTLLFTVPYNAYLASWLLTNQRSASLISQAIVACIALQEVTVIFGLHFGLSKFSKLIHAPAKVLLCQSIRNWQYIGHLRTQIRLADTIAAFAPNRPSKRYFY